MDRERVTPAAKDQAGQDSERQRHQKNERARVQRQRAVEARRRHRGGRLQRVETMRHERLGERTLRLRVKVRIERCREDGAARQRFRCEEEHVRHEEERHRSEIRFPSSPERRDGQKPRARDQAAEAARHAAVDAGERFERRLGESAQRQFVRPQRRLAAPRTVGVDTASRHDGQIHGADAIMASPSAGIVS